MMTMKNEPKIYRGTLFNFPTICPTISEVKKLLIYEDDFSQVSSEYLTSSGQLDSLGNRLVQNTESNGRFHTDWLNMMYPRLYLARKLLTDDGFIFISIDFLLFLHKNLIIIAKNFKIFNFNKIN